MVIDLLSWKINNKKINVVVLPFSENYSDAVKLVKEFRIDYIDALMLVHFVESTHYDLFVTADKALTKAATSLGITCWNVLKQNYADFSKTAGSF